MQLVIKENIVKILLGTLVVAGAAFMLYGFLFVN